MYDFFPEGSLWQLASKLNSLLTSENERLLQLTEDLKQKHSHMTSEVKIIFLSIVVGTAVFSKNVSLNLAPTGFRCFVVPSSRFSKRFVAVSLSGPVPVSRSCSKQS